MPTESDRNCQYASSSSRELGLLIGEDLKYIIVLTDIFSGHRCWESTWIDEIVACFQLSNWAEPADLCNDTILLKW